MIFCNYCQFLPYEFNDEESNSDHKLVIQKRKIQKDHIAMLYPLFVWTIAVSV